MPPSRKSMSPTAFTETTREPFWAPQSPTVPLAGHEAVGFISPPARHELVILLTSTNLGRRLQDLLTHGWGELHIVVTDHTITKIQTTLTDT